MGSVLSRTSTSVNCNHNHNNTTDNRTKSVNPNNTTDASDICKYYERPGLVLVPGEYDSRRVQELSPNELIAWIKNLNEKPLQRKRKQDGNDSSDFEFEKAVLVNQLGMLLQFKNLMDCNIQRYEKLSQLQKLNLTAKYENKRLQREMTLEMALWKRKEKYWKEKENRWKEKEKYLKEEKKYWKQNHDAWILKLDEERKKKNALEFEILELQQKVVKLQYEQELLNQFFSKVTNMPVVISHPMLMTVD